MTENDVKVIVYNAFNKYELETALPRHTELTKSISEIFASIHKARGAFILGTVLVGLPCAAAAVLEIIKYVKTGL